MNFSQYFVIILISAIDPRIPKNIHKIFILLLYSAALHLQFINNSYH